MKKRMSQKILRPNRKMASSVKQSTLSSTASNSLKVPKKTKGRKNRIFGDDITNLQKEPVFQQILSEPPATPEIKVSSKNSQLEPYLCQIGCHVQYLDAQYNINVLSKLANKSSDSTEITFDMRKVLIKWIIQVADKFKACQQTVHICVQIIDYILVFSHKKITKLNFQLLGIAALFVASKYNEIYTPEAKKYTYVCDGLYTLEQLFYMESYILTLTNFNLQFPTLHNFIGPLKKQADLGQEFEKLVDNISKVSVLDFNLFNRYKKQDVSGVIMFLSAKMSNSDRFSEVQIMQRMNMNFQTFKKCSQLVFGLYRQHYKPVPQNPQTKDY